MDVDDEGFIASDPIAAMGEKLIALGTALKNPGTDMRDIARLADDCGLEFQFRFTQDGKN